MKIILGGILDKIQNCFLYDGWLFFQSLCAVFLEQISLASFIATSFLDISVLVFMATLSHYWLSRFIIVLLACTLGIFLAPHQVEFRIEGRITLDLTCSVVSRCIEEIVEAPPSNGAVFWEAIPQTLKVRNDKRIIIVGGVCFVVNFHIVIASSDPGRIRYLVGL